jgi:hypothetical protein
MVAVDPTSGDVVWDDFQGTQTLYTETSFMSYRTSKPTPLLSCKRFQIRHHYHAVDNFMRSSLETRLAQLNPSEVLLPGKAGVMSSLTLKMIRQLV